MPETVRDAISRARIERTPVMALRPDNHGPDLLDDVVVKDVEMFRAEAMYDDVWWMCCYLANGERVTFHVVATDGALQVSATEKPSEWIDMDR